jgi:hypothetical protein
MNDRDERDREHDRDGPRRREPRSERPSGHMLVREHDQVREVRPGEEERRGVRHEHRAVEERPLAEEPPPRRVEEDGRHEDHRGVEVQHDRDGRVEQQQPAEQNDRPARRAGNPRARRLEDAVGRRRGADEQ